MSETDLAWAAGFVDGEGSIGVYAGLKFAVAQVDRAPLERLQEMFGGRIHGPYQQGVRWGALQWHISGSSASRALAQLLPYLMVKRGQAELAITYQSLLRNKTHGRRDLLTWQERAERDSFAEALREAKHIYLSR